MKPILTALPTQLHGGAITLDTTDGYTYLLTIKKSSTNTTNYYHIKINQGDIAAAAESATYYVSVTVSDRKKTLDGDLVDVTKAYTVDDTETTGGADVISALLDDKVTVVEENGKVTLKFNGSYSTSADGTTYTYTSGGTTYTITKADGSNGSTVYTVKTGSENNSTTYVVTLNPGDITEPTHHNVTITVADGKYTDGNYSGGEYSFTNGSLPSDFTVTSTKTTVNGTEITVVTITYGGTTYTINSENVTKDSSGNYKFTIQISDTEEYIITVYPGNVTSTTTPSTPSNPEPSTPSTPSNPEPSTPSTPSNPEPSTPSTPSNPEPSTPSTPSNPEPSTPSTPSNPEPSTPSTPTNTEPTTPIDNTPATPEPTTTYTSVTISVGDGTLTDGVFSNTGYTVGNPIIEALLNGATVTYTSDGKTILTGLPSSLTPNGDGTYNYTVTDADGNKTIYTITIDPGLLSIFNTPIPEPTTPEPEQPAAPTTDYVSVVINVGDGSLIDGVFSNTGFSVGNPIIEALLNGATVTYANGQTILTNLPSAFTSNGDGTYNYTVTDADGNKTVYVISIDPGLLSIYNTPPTTEEEEPEIYGAHPEEFNAEKGDYVDLDLQDHTLIEITDTNVAVDELNATPDEFSADASRNIVNNDSSMELTSIADTSVSDISTGGNDGGFANSTSNNSQSGGRNSSSSSNFNSAGGRSNSSSSVGRGNNGLSNFGQTGGRNNRGSSNQTSQDGDSDSINGDNGLTSLSLADNNSTSDIGDSGDSSDNSSSSSNDENQSSGLGNVEEGRSDASQEGDDANSSQNSQDSNSESEDSQEKSDSKDEDSKSENSDEEEEDDENSEDEEDNSGDRPRNERQGDRGRQNPGQPPQGQQGQPPQQGGRMMPPPSQR